MKKTFKSYVICWAILFAVFSVVAFVSPGWAGIEKYTASFWIGYVLIAVAMAGQLFCAYTAFKAENLKKLFYNMPLITVSYGGMVASFVAGVLCMVISPLPYFVGVIISVIILAFTAIAVFKAKVAGEIVEKIDEKVKSKTAFIKMLTADAEHLMNTAKTPELKAQAKKVYESIRYSDPMSNDALASVESQITLKFNEFSEAVVNNSENVAEIANELIVLIGDRNKKCRLLK